MLETEWVYLFSEIPLNGLPCDGGVELGEREERLERVNSLLGRSCHQWAVPLTPVLEVFNAGAGAVQIRPFSLGSLNLDTAEAVDIGHKRGQMAGAYHSR